MLRRLPVPLLRPELDLCVPTGATLAAGARVLIVPDAGGVAAALAGLLAQRGLAPVVLGPGEPDPWLLAAPVAGVYHLAVLDLHPDLLTASAAVVDERLAGAVGRLAQLGRALLPGLGRAGAFLLAATRLGGLHGYGSVAPTDPAGGAVAGFVKASGREQPDATVKVVDFELDADPATVARALLAETERDPGAVEVGHAFGARHAVGLALAPAPARDAALALGPDSVVLVTGAAGGITAAITAELARASRGTFYLADLTPAPAANDPDLARIATDRDGLRRDLIARRGAGGARVTPAQVERTLADLERRAAVQTLCDDVERAGAHAHYRVLDVRDGAAVAALAAERSITIGEQFQETRHFCGTVRLSRAAGDAPRLAGPPVRGGRTVSDADIDRIFFHGPSYRVLEGVEVGEGALHGRMRADRPPALGHPAATLLSPRVIELCLQTAGVYEIGATGRLALPAAIDRIVAPAAPAESTPLRAEVTPHTAGGALSFDARVCDLEGRVHLALNGYRTAALPSGLPDELVEPLRAAVGRQPSRVESQTP